MEESRSFFKKALSNLSFLFFGGVLSAFFIFATQVILARELNASGFGNFMAALASITLLAPLAVFGVTQSWLKLYGIEGIGANRWVDVTLKLLVITFVFSFVILILWAFFGPHNLEFKFILLGLLPLVISHIFIELVNTRFQLEGRYKALALWQNLMLLLRFGFVTTSTVLLVKPLSINSIVFGYSSISILVSLVGYFFLSPMIKGKIKLNIPMSNQFRTNKRVLKKLSISDIFFHSLPYGLATLFYLIYLQSDLIFLKYLVNDAAAGIYAAAFTILISIYFIPGVIYNKFLLPKIHGWANHDQPKLLKIYQGGNGLMLILGLLILVVFFFSTPLIIPIIFGSEYQETSKILRILLFCIPIRFLATSIESPLYTKDLMKWKTGSMGIAAALNIVLNLMLIPSYSYYGAAVATLISEFVVLILYLLVVTKKLFGANAWRGWTNGFNSSFWKSIS